MLYFFIGLHDGSATGVVDAVFVNHEGAEQPVKLKELHEVG